MVYLKTECYSEPKRNGLSRCEKTKMYLKHILPNERSQSEKATYYMILTI